MLSIQMKTFWWLVWRDIRILFTNIISTIFDSLILPISFILINGYVMPALGTPESYGSFMVLGWFIIMSLNTQSTAAGDLVTDMSTNKAIYYELTLPLPYWLTYVKYGIVYAVKSMIANMGVIPLGILLLFKRFNLAGLCVYKALLFFVVMNIFLASISLISAVSSKTSDSYWRFWLRWGWQLLNWGGLCASWFTMHKIFPRLALIDLLNPFVYIFDGMRSAILGQSGYLNFWLCLGVTLLVSLAFGYIGVRIFKKRMDCV